MDSFIHNKTGKILICVHLFLSAVPPSISGGCDSQNYYILVKYGNQGFNFQTVVGKQMLTSGLAQQYSFMDNDTHCSFIVPFSSSDVVVEVRSESAHDECAGIYL